MTISLTKVANNNYSLQQDEIIELQGIGKRYPLAKQLNKGARDNFGDFWALRDVSLKVYQGEILGIIGRNGAGKTTLLNIIAGVLSPTQGRINVNGRVLGLFNLGVGFQDELAGRENIFLNGAILGASRKELENKLRSIIEFSELGDFINMPLGTYSQGMRLRLGFSIIANLDFDILVIDEVLAVGDALFQSKCFERLMDFRRLGKTLIITSQGMDLIERLCDKAVLLDNGRLLFQGDPVEGINKYRALLNTEKFFVGPQQTSAGLVENTKKWADDISNWGKRLGTKEAVIEKVEFINKLGLRCNLVKSGEPLKIKVKFSVRENIKEPHFGVAIFRNDGVYCYGPNTAFDGYEIPELKKGKGYFILKYHKLLLAPGDYVFSIAIWDKKETLAFDYHYGYYKLKVTGYNNIVNELINIPFRFKSNGSIDRLILSKVKLRPGLNLIEDKWGQKIETEGLKIESIKFLNSLDKEKNIFITNELLELNIDFSIYDTRKKNYLLWIGIYRDDGIYCQGFTRKVNFKDKKIILILSQLKLLPGNYRISIGFWDNNRKCFTVCHHGEYLLKVISNKADHGTVFLDHRWKLRLP